MNVSEVLHDEQNFYIVAEQLKGGELFERIINGQTLTEEKAAKTIRQILLAINYMHQKNIIHRDLKPENILFESKDNEDVKITDFGFAAFFDPKDGLSLILGSPLYMAPEIVKGNYYNEKVDIWSIGVITYMLLSGRSPFPGKTNDDIKHLIVHKHINLDNTEYFKHCSPDSKQFIQKCLNRNIYLRSTAEDLLNHPWLKNSNQV